MPDKKTRRASEDDEDDSYMPAMNITSGARRTTTTNTTTTRAAPVDDTTNSSRAATSGNTRTLSSNSSSNMFPSYYKSIPDQELIRNTIKKSPFFGSLTTEQIDRFVSVAHLKEYSIGDVIILQGCVDIDNYSGATSTNSNNSKEKTSNHDQSGRVAVGRNIAANINDSYHHAIMIMQEEEKSLADPDDDDDDDDVSNNVHRIVDDSLITTTPLLVESPEPTSPNGPPPAEEVKIADPAMDYNDKPIVPKSIIMRPRWFARPQSIDKKKDDESLSNTSKPVLTPSSTAPALAAPTSSITTQTDIIPPTTTRKKQRKLTTNNDTTPPPPQSNIPRSIYIIRQGQADVYYQNDFHAASLGPGMMFGEGGFLFGRQHSASIIASPSVLSSSQQQQQQSSSQQRPSSPSTLQCWVVDLRTFRKHVLPTMKQSELFREYATQHDEQDIPYMEMNDFVNLCQQKEPYLMRDPLMSVRIATIYNILHQKKPPLLLSSSSSSSIRPTTTTSTSSSTPSSIGLSIPLRIYLEDFCYLYLLMARPDPEVDIAFLLMDQKQTGLIDLHDLMEFMEPIFPHINIESQFFQRYFFSSGTQRQQQPNANRILLHQGQTLNDHHPLLLNDGATSSTGSASIRATHFSQFLVDLQREMGKQAFWQAVQTNGTSDGYLAPRDFVEILKMSLGWTIPKAVADRLQSLYLSNSIHPTVNMNSPSMTNPPTNQIKEGTTLPTKYFAYADYVAFQEVLGNLPGICNLIHHAEQIKGSPISAEDFKVANRAIGFGSRLSRLQVDVVFALFDLDHDGCISHDDTIHVCGLDFVQQLIVDSDRGGRLSLAVPTKQQLPPSTSSTIDSNKTFDHGHLYRYLVTFLQDFGLTAIASTVGVALLYPLDLVKTRMMNQRVPIGRVGMYRNWADCLQQAIRFETYLGLYRGILPPLLGAAPERIIKLQVHNLIGQAYSDNDGSTHLTPNWGLEMISGACAGACQLLVTNPMELIKIRQQLQGETSRLATSQGLIMPHPRRSFVEILRDLGFPGVYRGASACLLRDIPFSAIFFPVYAFGKKYLTELDISHVTMLSLSSSSTSLIAGIMAGIPAALLTCPADVIKTRLQAPPRPGEVTYSGIRDCAIKMYHQEGSQAFFRGSMARTLRIPPQIGISICIYEQLLVWSNSKN